MIKTVLLDIEGTTTSISFVHDTLFPYAKSRLADFVSENITNSDVAKCVEETRCTVRDEEAKEIDNAGAIKTLLQWIDTDRKHPALKALQGYIWKNGYETGDYTAHVYDDVKAYMQKWKEKGLTIAIYSSGSVNAQKLLFKYTCSGDLTPLISHYFDLSIGGKKDNASYSHIAHQIGVNVDEILFLSDSVEELDAAKSAGFSSTQLVRPGTDRCNSHPAVADFTELVITA